MFVFQINLLERLDSMVALVSALVTLTTGIVGLLIEILKHREYRMKSSGGTGKPNLFVMGFSSALIVVGIVLFGGWAWATKSQCQTSPKNVKLICEAWEAYENKEYDKAIVRAQEIVEEFAEDAEETQQNLGEQCPTKADEIKENGLLNDVATAYYIIGESHRKLGQKENSKLNFCKVQDLPCGRTAVDSTATSFWSPARKARSRLKKLGACQ